MTEEQLEALEAELDDLRRIIVQALGDYQPPALYYLPSEYDEECPNFCFDCAKKKLEELQAREPEEDRDEGLRPICGAHMDEDVPRWCDTCRTQLAHSLTEYCVEQEVEHYETYGDEEDARNETSLWNLLSILHHLGHGTWMSKHAPRAAAAIRPIVAHLLKDHHGLPLAHGGAHAG